MGRVKEFLFKKRKLSKRAIAVILIISVVFSVYTAFDNFRIDTDYITISSPEISGDFDGYKIAHISDYHNRKSELIDKKLFEVLNAEKPDIIVLTGDLIDCRTPDTECALSFAEMLTGIAPVYFVTGNHECNYSIFDQSAFNSFMFDLRGKGVTVLSNETLILADDDGAFIYLHGIEDPYFTSGDNKGIIKATDDMCSALSVDDGFNILLAHHPEQLDIYAQYGFDLVFSGHAHGGQITLFGLGIMAPDQSYFPEYTSGLYEKDGTELVLSRGIGYSLAPIRVFCPPHLIITELKNK